VKKLETFLLVTAIVLIGITGYIWFKLRLSEEIPVAVTPVKEDYALTVGLIGDSWVAHNNLDTILENDLAESGLSATIYSSGQSGAKTKLVYLNLFKPAGEAFSSSFILGQQPDYCCVITGVNDAVAQAGAQAYAHHLILIMRAMIKKGITPVIVPLPEVDVESEVNNTKFLWRWRSKILSQFTNGGKLDNIRVYRGLFLQELERSGLKKKVICIDFDRVSREYEENPELYADFVHLSLAGKQKLGKEIAAAISRDYKARRLSAGKQ
jgi:hypothetical protein